MRIIGLTGGICSGKTSCTQHLVDTHGLSIVDADKLGHIAYRSGTDCFRAVVDAFGQGVVGADGEINRRALGPIVFSSRDEMTKLCRIVWPEIANLIRQRISDAEQAGTEVLVFEAAVLLEAGWNSLMTEVWVLECDPDVAKGRLMARNGCSEAKASEIMSNQMTNAEKRVHADHIIDTNVPKPEMFARLDDVFGRT